MKTKFKSLICLVLTIALVLSISSVGTYADDYMVEVTFYSGDYGYFSENNSGVIILDLPDGGSYDPDTLIPVPINSNYVFSGWFSGIQGTGKEITSRLITDDFSTFYAYWKPDTTVIPAISLDDEINMEISGAGLLYQFTPSETAVYEVFTTGNNPENAVANIRILDGDLRTVALSNSSDYSYNAVVSTELTEGVTYFIEFSSVFGEATSYTGTLKKTEFVPITFHANPPSEGAVYFDDNTSKTEKTIDVRKGAHVESYRVDGFTIADGANLMLDGWSLNAGAETKDTEIIAEEATDVYGVYISYKSVMLDANGGAFTTFGQDVTEHIYTYFEGGMFSPAFSPVIDDQSKLFAGWATTPTATEPDVIEGESYDDLGERLYAVYSDVLNVTVDANGGYLFTNPELTVYNTTVGKGQAFYPYHAEHNDPYMSLMGWKDQNDVIIPATTTTYPGYQYTEDTYLTALWGRRIVVDANGGCFRFDASLTAVQLTLASYEPFDSNDIINLVGEPINFDDLQYLAGYATTPDATEPDIIDGVTDLNGVTHIYAIWKTDEYKLVSDDNQTWVKGSTDGLSFTVKRTGDDSVTFSCYDGTLVDDTEVFYPDLNIAEGSLILNLTPEYLESLEAGEHKVRIRFTAEAFVEASFTVTEPDEPQTGDNSNLGLWISLLLLSAAGLVTVITLRKKHESD